MATTSPVKGSVRAGAAIWVPLLMMLALAFAGALLFSNLPNTPARVHAYLSSLPLAMAGIGYAILQLRVRLSRPLLLKRLLLAGTFVIWAIDQLLPSGRLATFIGDVVIAAYVLDLCWLIQEQVASTNPISHSRDRST
jgi:hypothetical protein